MPDCQTVKINCNLEKKLRRIRYAIRLFRDWPWWPRSLIQSIPKFKLGMSRLDPGSNPAWAWYRDGPAAIIRPVVASI